MTRKYKKKLIEVAIPLDAINDASVREKSTRKGHPSAMHLWWARRPLAAARAVLFAQLVDDPSNYVDDLLQDSDTKAAANDELKKRLIAWKEMRKQGEDGGSEPEPTIEDCVASIERNRLFGIIEDLVKWKNSTDEQILERAQKEIHRSCDGEVPSIYDPFSGGGAIPLEAQRLGMKAYGSDLNPVAVVIGKSMIEIPSKFANCYPVHQEIHTQNHYRNAQGLAENVKHYSEWMKNEAWNRIGHLYPRAPSSQKAGGGQTLSLHGYGLVPFRVRIPPFLALQSLSCRVLCSGLKRKVRKQLGLNRQFAESRELLLTQFVKGLRTLILRLQELEQKPGPQLFGVLCQGPRLRQSI